MKKNMHLKAACYSMSITMSIVSNLPPILFLTFRSLLGLSYSELGLLVLMNFSTQLAMRIALLVGALFPLAAIFVFYVYQEKLQKTGKEIYKITDIRKIFRCPLLFVFFVML